MFELNGLSYKIVLEEDDPRTWVEAEEICHDEEGGHLVSITSEEENLFINDKIRLVSQNQHVQRLWIGAIDEEIFGNYKWVDGIPFRYQAAGWSPGQAAGRTQHDYETCIMFKSTADEGEWEEDDCYITKGYICKIEGRNLWTIYLSN